jgi:uncharacterized membrane protein YphA (DoxX/SURF4 family)
MEKITITGNVEKQTFLIKLISRSRLKKSTIIDIICFLFILLFVYAALTKLVDYQKFRVQLGQSPILTAFADFVSITVPGIEIIIAVMLSFQKLRLFALYAAFSLMIMFTAYIIVITKFSEYIPCSCGGVLQNMSWNQHLIFNIVFVILGLMGIVIQSKSMSN